MGETKWKSITPLATYLWGNKTYITDGKTVWVYDGKTIAEREPYRPTLTLNDVMNNLPSKRVKIDGDDGNTYTGELISWSKRPIKIRLDDGTAMRFRTD